jgi:hypothetical protein
MTRSYLVEGDPFDPQPMDIIVQVDVLPVSKPLPDGWTVLGGNHLNSTIARVTTRYKAEP